MRGMICFLSLVVTWSSAAAKDTLTFDLSAGVIPTYATVKGASPAEETRLRAINLIVNSVSWAKDLRAAEAFGKDPRRARIDVTGALGKDTLAFLKKTNPYDCSADRSGPLRVDWLASRMREEGYKDLLGLRKLDFPALAKKLGVPSDTDDARWRKTLFRPKGAESRISVGERAVLMAKGTHGTVALTIDGALDTRGIRSPFRMLDYDRAGEMIFRLPNGLHGYALIAPDEKDRKKLVFANVAPTDLVTNNFATLGAWGAKHLLSSHAANAHRGPIGLGTDCMTCHRGGFIGPQRGLRAASASIEAEMAARLLKAESPEDKASLKKHAKGLSFLSATDYDDQTTKDSRDFVALLKKAGAFVPDEKVASRPAPVAADTETLYGEPLTLDEAARELGTSEKGLRKILARPEIKKRLASFGTGDALKEVLAGSFNRTWLEAIFCPARAEMKALGLTPRPRPLPIAAIERRVRARKPPDPEAPGAPAGLPVAQTPEAH